MKMLIKSIKGSNCIPPLINSINDENLEMKTSVIYKINTLTLYRS